MFNATRISFRVLVIAVTAVGLARSSAAAPITWMFTGPVSGASGVLTGVIPLGTPATATVTIESTATSNFCSSGTGGTFSPVSAVLSVGEFNVPYPSGFVMVNTTGGSCGSSGYAEFIFGGGLWPSMGGFSSNLIGPELRFVTQAFDGTATTLGEIFAFPPQRGFFSVQGFNQGSAGGLQFGGAVVQQPAPVPEPGTMFLFGTGALLAARAARRKRFNDRRH